LTKGQQDSNEKSNSDLIFEFEMNLIEIAPIDSNSELHPWLGCDYMKQILGMLQPSPLREIWSWGYEHRRSYKRGYLRITAAEENLDSWSGENPWSPK
jgi:hypothetical protein